MPGLGRATDPWETIRICLGLLIVGQGFETSRFLGSEHSTGQRIRTMSSAQGILAVVYLTILGLMLVVMIPAETSPDARVTAIVTLAGSVASVLPMLIIIAAIGSEFRQQRPMKRDAVDC